jgi:hypothetical protein
MNKGFLLYLRSEVERYSGKRDPYARSQEEDEKDLLLFSHINASDAPSKEGRGRDLDITDYVFWILRMMTAHFPIVDRFGRYPYNNDLVGRDWAAGELEWLESTGSPHLPENLKKSIREDVEDGTWTPFKGNPKFD